MNACSSDDLFGPVAIGCRDNFDFTLFFEQSILSIVPSAIFLTLVPLRLIPLWKSNVKTIPNLLSKLTVFSSIVLVGLQLALLIAWANQPATRASVPAAALSFVDSLAFLALTSASPRHVRPISLLSQYLLFSIGFSIVELRTLYLREDPQVILGLSITILTVKLLLLLLETQTRRKWLRAPYQRYSPEATSGVINRGLFWWVNPLMTAGFRKILSLDDLYTTDPSLETEALEKQMQWAWNRYIDSKQLPLLKASLYCFRWQLLSFVFPRLLLVGFNFAQPFLISRVVQYVDQPINETNKNDGYGLIGAAVLVYIGIALSSVHYQHKLFRSVTMFRGAIISMIYSKSLDIPASSYDDAAALTLMTADVDRIIMGFESLSQLWAYVIEIAIGVLLLAFQVGWICFAPILVVIAGVYGSVLISRYVVGAQKAWMSAIQSRIAITSPALNSMKAIKMMGLSRLLSKKLQDYRINELDLSAKYRQLSTWRITLSTLPQIGAPFVVFVIYAIQASIRGIDGINTSQAFTSLAIITLLTGPAGSLLSAIPSIGVCHGCLSRIEAYLQLDSWQDERKSSDQLETQVVGSVNRFKTSKTDKKTTKIAVTVENASLRPSDESSLAIQELTFAASVGSLIMITGPVGSGKTTLLRGILGDIACVSGSIYTHRKEIAYCSQTTWLPNGTIRDIVCGNQDVLDIDQQWYETTIRDCALDHDIGQLSDGHETVIGTRGVSLSGGQKQRLALARAVYARKDIILLDDVLSALDNSTEQLIIDRLLDQDGLLRKMSTTVILAGHAWRPMHLADNIIVLTKNGNLRAQGKWDDLRSRGILNDDFIKTAQSLDSGPATEKAKPVPKALKGASANDIADLQRQTGDASLYLYYGKTIGPKMSAIIITSAAFCAVTVFFPQIWIKWYSTGAIQGDALFCGIYTLLVVIALGALYMSAWTFYCLGIPKSGARLHEILLKTTFDAPQSYFDKTDAGVTLNRFSQDMSLIDGSLPAAALITLQAVMNAIVLVAFVAAGSSYMGLTTPLLLLALYGLQKLYLRTSRQIRFLDIEAKAPLYSHFVETLEGLPTIRAFGWQSRFSSEFQMLLDTSQKPYYMLYCIQRWLNLALGLITAAMAVTVISLSIAIRSSTSAGSLGVALNGVLSLDTTFQYLMLFWTSLETSLGAVSRIRSFEKDTPTEIRSDQNLEPPLSWPSSGKIEYSNLEARYTASSDEPALSVSSLLLKPSTKAGIIGRTGSGKSTMLSVTTGLLPLGRGEILIDDLPISQIPVQTLRERIVTIPQDPFILPGLTVRENADLASAAGDEAITSALQKVGLWDTIIARGGLDAQMPGLSQGESQVFALVRALLRKKPNATGGILLLDEATSNTDPETDERMSKVIAEEFAGWTVVMIAHRLESVQRICDMVVKLDSGRVVRVGSVQDVIGDEETGSSEGGQH